MKTGFARLLTISCLAFFACACAAQSGKILHSFNGVDGSRPFGLIADSAGNLYGVSETGGGTQNCCGTVWELSPNGTGYKFSELHHFTDGNDGSGPIGTLALDSHGNIFGVTSLGGIRAKGCSPRCGTVYELTPKSGGGFTYSQIYRFQGVFAGDGADPWAGLVIDPSGNIFGTTRTGGLDLPSRFCDEVGCGTVFELSSTGSGWAETVLYKFAGDSAGTSDGAFPEGQLAFDSAGNLDGTTSEGGDYSSCHTGCGTFYQLVPSGGGWVENVAYRFTFDQGFVPYQNLTFDSAGNVYGVNNVGGTLGQGTAFELSPGAGTWTESTILAFNDASTGGAPAGGLVMDAGGNLYGTAFLGGAHDAGLIFRLTPAPGGGFTYATVKSFQGSNGSGPDGNLLLNAAGNIFGTAGYGGVKNLGVVFEITP